MTPRRWTRDDFNRPTLRVARALLGQTLVRCVGRRELAATVVEVEAYGGVRDRACHSFGGRRTPRVEPLYAEGGTAYVYLVYGLHRLLNFSTAGLGNPEGVLIRAVMDVEGRRIVGPGRVSKFLEVDGRLSGLDTTRGAALRVEDRGLRVRDILRGPRVGVDYAGPVWASKPWRLTWKAPGL